MVGIQVADTARWPRSYLPGSLPGRGRAGSGGLERHRGREPPPGSLSRAPAAVSGLLISNPCPGPCRWTVPPAPCACARGAPRWGPALGAPAPPPAEASGCARAEPRASHLLSGAELLTQAQGGGLRAAPRARDPPRERASVLDARQLCDGGDDALRTLGIKSPPRPAIAWLEGIAMMSL